MNCIKRSKKYSSGVCSIHVSVLIEESKGLREETVLHSFATQKAGGESVCGVCVEKRVCRVYKAGALQEHSVVQISSLILCRILRYETEQSPNPAMMQLHRMLSFVLQFRCFISISVCFSSSGWIGVIILVPSELLTFLSVRVPVILELVCLSRLGGFTLAISMMLVSELVA